MNLTKRFAVAMAILVLAGSLSGCQTPGEAAGLGAVIGATTGAMIGDSTGHAGGGAVIGAAYGAIVGLAAHDAQVRRVSYPPAHEYHPPNPHPDESLVLEEASVLPSRVRRGSMVEASIQYEVLGNRYGTRVTETRELLRDGETIQRLYTKSAVRQDGSWVSAQQFRVAEDLEPGEYTLVQTIRARGMTVSSANKISVN